MAKGQILEEKKMSEHARDDIYSSILTKLGRNVCLQKIFKKRNWVT